MKKSDLLLLLIFIVILMIALLASCATPKFVYECETFKKRSPHNIVTQDSRVYHFTDYEYQRFMNHQGVSGGQFGPDTLWYEDMRYCYKIKDK